MCNHDVAVSISSIGTLLISCPEISNSVSMRFGEVFVILITESVDQCDVIPQSGHCSFGAEFLFFKLARFAPDGKC